jgi:hypothetical protein
LRGDTMRAYRLYTYDKEGNLIGPAVPIAADDDAHAIEHARKLLNSHIAELREDLRLVEKFESRQ